VTERTQPAHKPLLYDLRMEYFVPGYSSIHLLSIFGAYLYITKYYLIYFVV